MSEEEMQDIIKDLASRGFKDEQLRSDIERIEALGLPTFNVTREKVFGAERMFYRLQFQWLEYNLGYELTAIAANHRMPVDIEQMIVNGINSQQLDKEMVAINWEKYWGHKLKVKPEDNFFDMAYNNIDALAQLLLNESANVNWVAEQLMYKHWPAEIFDMFSKDPQRMHNLFEHNFTFSINENPDITAELAYLIISERTPALEMHLEELRLPKALSPAINAEARSVLKDMPDAGELKFNFSTETYYVSLGVQINMHRGWYQVNSYDLAVSVFPEIKHGVFNGVDSERLDKKLATVDWRTDQSIVDTNTASGAWFPRDIELLQEELFRMTFAPEGKEVMELLTLKHWLCAPFFEDLITEQAKEMLKNMPVKSAKFSTEISVDKAINLLLGSPVYKQLSKDATQGVWQRLVSPPDGTPAFIEEFLGTSRKILGKILDMAPIPEYRKERVLDQLLKGMPVKTEANSGDMIGIRLTENTQEIKLFDRDHREIPFNFKLDPDWKPDQKHQETKQENRQHPTKFQQKIQSEDRFKKGKGKGL